MDKLMKATFFFFLPPLFQLRQTVIRFTVSLPADRVAGPDRPERQRKGEELPEVSHRLSSTRCSSSSRQAV